LSPKKETVTTKEQDFTEKLHSIPKEDRKDYRVRIFRTLPEYDKNNMYIAGYQGSFPLGEYIARGGEDLIMEKFGGNEYTVEVRGHAGTPHAGQYVGRASVSVPGAARLVGIQEVSPAQQPEAHRAASGRSYEEGIAEGLRKAEHDSELRELRNSISRLEKALHSSNGNGHGRSDFLDAVEAVGKLRDVVGIGSGQGGSLDTLTLLKLLKDERDSGQKQGERLAELVAQLGSDADGDAGVEKEMVKILGDLLNAGKAEKLAKLKLSGGGKGKATPAQIANAAFAQFRDQLAQVVTEYSAFAGSALQGSKTLDELLTNVRQFLDYMVGEEENEGEGEVAEENGEPGQDQPGTGDTEPGAQNQDPGPR